MTSNLFTNEEVNLLFAIRSRAIDCKSNYKNRYKEGDLMCRICSEEKETKIRLLKCKVLNNELNRQGGIKHFTSWESIFSVKNFAQNSRSQMQQRLENKLGLSCAKLRLA